MSPAQLALDLQYRPAFGLDAFLVSGSNADAVAWLDKWPDWPASGLAINGPAGCGKTHLVHVWAGIANARIVAAADLAGMDIPALAVGPVALEDCDKAVDEETLLHLYNLLRENDQYLLITGATPPSRWNLTLPDLISRLKALPSVAVGAPDDDLLAGVLKKQFDDRQLPVGDDVVHYLVARMHRSFEAAARIVTGMDRAALAARRRITVPLAAKVLEQVETEN